MNEVGDETLKKLTRWAFIAVGTLFLVLGVIGIFVPLLPTTPLLLLAAACYYKGSRRMYEWLLNNGWFGTYIRNYKEKRGIPMTTKALIIVLLWMAIAYSAYVVRIFIVQISLFTIAMAVSVHVLRLPTYKKL